MKNSNHFAEIIESSLPVFLAQSWQWDKAPTFGSLIVATIGSRTIFALVHQIQTGSMDAHRSPFPYQKTHEELLQEQPQIFEFLRTTFSCITVGYQEKGKLLYLLTPEPLKIHTMIRSATREECALFFDTDQYLSLVFGAQQHLFNIDELLLAIIRYQVELGIINQQKLARLLNTFSLLTGNDYRRLKLLLQRMQLFLPSV